MSDQSQGPGWWQASDGRWYAPELHPDYVAPAPGQGVPEAPAATPDATAPITPPGAEAPGFAPVGDVTAPVAPVPAPDPTAAYGTPVGGPAGGPVGGPPPVVPPAAGRSNTGRIVAIAVVLALVLGGVAFALANRDDSKKTATSNSELSSDSSSSSSSSRSSSSKSSSSSSRSSSSKSSSSSGISVDAPAGYTAYKDQANGFGAALPDSYQTIDLSSGDIDKIIETLRQSNPTVADIMEKNKASFQKGVVLFAYDTAASGAFTDNINVIKLTQSVGDPTSSSFLSQVEQQLTSIGATNVTTSSRSTGSGKAGIATFTITTTAADGSTIDVDGEQAYIVSSGKTWIISASTLGGTDAFDTLVQTFVTA